MLKSLAFLGACSPALAALVQKNWDIGWVNRSPNGVARPVIGINGQWPLPLLEATVGDTVRITVNNKLGNETTGIHWHGLHQIGSNEMDGPAGATQCPIPPGKSFTYEFVVNYPGTYWYHSHVGTQYPDGLRGPLIVKHGYSHPDPYAGKYEKEYLITLSDWYNTEVPTILDTVVFNPSLGGRPPPPVAGLINDGAGATYDLVPGKKYKFRIINMSALAGCILAFGDNDVEIIETDGVDTKSTKAEMLYVTPAQRYSVIVTAKSTKEKNYAITGIFDVNPNFRANPPVVGFPFNVTAQLRYDSSKPAATQVLVSNADFSKITNDFTLRPYKQVTLGKSDIKLTMDFNINADGTNPPRATINGKTYIHQKVPTLYSVLSTGKDASNPAIYGEVNPFIVKKDQVVEIILNNLHPAHHPFHFHGHHFQVCSRGAPQAGKAPAVECKDDALVRDVINVEGGSSAIIRFKADNPGVWLLHCHIEWHVPLGLSATIIEDVKGIQDTIKVPKEHFEICKAQCLPWEGNAGGNTKDVTDLSTANNKPSDEEHSAVYKQKTCPANPSTTATTKTYGTKTSTSTKTGTASTKKPTGSHSDYPSGYPTGYPSPTVSLSTSTLYATSTYTVTSCKPTVTNCHAGAVVTEVVPYTTTVCPVTVTPTYTYVKPTGTVVPKPDYDHDDDDEYDTEYKPIPGSSYVPATTFAPVVTPAYPYPSGGSGSGSGSGSGPYPSGGSGSGSYPDDTPGTIGYKPTATGPGKTLVTGAASAKSASLALAVAGVVAALL